jgi:hypothetical protein
MAPIPRVLPRRPVPPGRRGRCRPPCPQLGSGFAFRYDIRGDQEEETGYHFSTDRFMVGDYVSVREEDGLHTFQVASIEPI